MTSKKKTLDIYYHVKNDRFRVPAGLRIEERIEILENLLRNMVNCEEKKGKTIQRDFYHIQIKDDAHSIRVACNTGNETLRNGILMKYLGDLKFRRGFYS